MSNKLSFKMMMSGPKHVLHFLLQAAGDRWWTIINLDHEEASKLHKVTARLYTRHKCK